MDYTYELIIPDKFYKSFVDNVIAWRVDESFKDISLPDMEYSCWNEDATYALIEDVKTNPDDEGYVKSLYNNISFFYNKFTDGYITCQETSTLTGPVDTTVKYVDWDKGIRNMIVVAEVKSFNGDSWYKLLTQASRYCYSIERQETVFITILRGTQIAFFIYQPNFHESLNFFLKAPVYRNLLALVLHNDLIEILAQKNTYYPQMYIYDFASTSAEQIKGIHNIFKFQQQYSEVPCVVYDSTNNVINIVGGKIREGLQESLESRDQCDLKIKPDLDSKIKPDLDLKVKAKSGLWKASIKSKPSVNTSQLGLNLRLKSGFFFKQF